MGGFRLSPETLRARAPRVLGFRRGRRWHKPRASPACAGRTVGFAVSAPGFHLGRSGTRRELADFPEPTGFRRTGPGWTAAAVISGHHRDHRADRVCTRAASDVAWWTRLSPNPPARCPDGLGSHPIHQRYALKDRAFARPIIGMTWRGRLSPIPPAGQSGRQRFHVPDRGPMAFAAFTAPARKSVGRFPLSLYLPKEPASRRRTAFAVPTRTGCRRHEVTEVRLKNHRPDQRVWLAPFRADRGSVPRKRFHASSARTLPMGKVMTPSPKGNPRPVSSFRLRRVDIPPPLSTLIKSGWTSRPALNSH